MTDNDPTQPFATPPAAPPPPPGAAVTPVAPVVQQAGTPRTGRSRLRWLVAIVITLLVVATAAGATLLLTASAGDSSVLAYVPADSIAYEEVRLDLPGSQRAEVAKLLSAFPGFADQAALNAKLGEVLDRLVKAATGGKHAYQSEIAPWFGGQLAAAQGPLPGSTSATELLKGARMLVLAEVTDTGKATAWVNGVLAEAGATTSTETYGGATITRISEKSAAGAAAPDSGYVVLGHTLALGDLTSLKAAIDTKGTTGLGTTATFHKATAALAGDRIGFVWADLKAIMTGAAASITSAPGMSGSATVALGLLQGMVPDWTAAAIRAVDGNLELDGVHPHMGSTAATNRASDIAALSPSGTIALAEVRDVGASLKALHDKLAAVPAVADGLKQVDNALALLGGYDAVTGWIGDAGIALTKSGSSVTGGLIVKPADGKAAQQLFTQLHGFLLLGSASAGIGVSDETYGDATITTIDLSKLAPALAGMAGGTALGSVPGLETMLPSDLKLVYAATEQVVVLGVDPAFVKAVLDARTGPSLAKDPRFATPVGKIGARNTGVSWLDVAAVRGLVEAALPADARAKYESDIKPYLLPLDALVGVRTADGDLDRMSVILSVNH